MGASTSSLQMEELPWSADPEIRHWDVQWKGRDFMTRRTTNNFRVCDPVQGEKRLHFRLIFPPLPDSEAPTPEELRDHITNGVFLSFHGMGSHSNFTRPLECFTQLAREAKCVVIAPDGIGQGYSEGLRELINDFESPTHHFIDLAAALLSGSEDGDRLQCDDPRLKVLRARWEMDDCPLQCIGISLGGSFAIVATLAMQGFGFKVGTTPPRSWPMLQARFRGAILVSPFVTAPVPNPIITFILAGVIAPLLPNQTIPERYDPATDRSMMYRDPEYAELMGRNGWFEGGIGWGKPMRFRTGVSSLDAIKAFHNDETLKRITKSLLVLCDPEDQVTLFEGYQRIANLAENVDLVKIPEALHDIIVNEPDLPTRGELERQDTPARLPERELRKSKRRPR